jgi:hypothetical protein
LSSSKHRKGRTDDGTTNLIGWASRYTARIGIDDLNTALKAADAESVFSNGRIPVPAKSRHR